MTKILNSLKVTGTGSSSQALGVTGGYVSINDKLRIGDWSTPTATVNINSKGTTSSTNAFKITTGFTTNNFYPSLNYSDDGVLSLVGAGLGYGATNSGRPIGSADLVISSNYYGSIELAGYGIFGRDQGGSEGLSFYIRKAAGGAATYSRGFRFITATDRQFNLQPEADDTFSINYPTYNNGYIRLSSYNDSGKYFRISTDKFTSTQQSDRFGIQGFSDWASVFFRNISSLQIDNNAIVTRNIGTTTSNSFPNTFIIGSSQSSINIGTTYGIPTSWNQGSIIISPATAINMTASHFPVSGLTHTNNSNIMMVAQVSVIPTGNYNVMIGGGSKITTGSQNVGIGNYLYTTNPALGELTTGSRNTAVGSQALGKLTTGSDNVGLGDRALRDSSVSSSNNIGVGVQAGQSVQSSNNIFIGTNAGRAYNGTGDSVLYLSTHDFTSAARVEAAAAHYSSTYATWSGTPPSWATLNTSYGNVVIFGNESSGSRESSTINSTGTFRSLFFGKGMWHLSTNLNTYVISTSMPTLMTWTASGSITQNNDAVGSSLELVAGVGRGGGTAGDLYFSTGQLTASGTSSLQDKVTRMTIKGGSGFIGVGLTAPSTLLHIYSTQSNAFRLVDGTQGAGKALISDANGNASWGTASGSGVSGGSASYMALFTSATGLTPSNIYQGASGSILIGYTSSSSTYTTDTNTLRVNGNVYFDNSTSTSKFFLNGTNLFDNVNKNIALGASALGINNGSVGTNNVAIGEQSLKSNTGDRNIALGYQALLNNSNGTDNISIGEQSLKSNTGAGGSYNVAIGTSALNKNTSGYRNFALGYYSLYSNLTGDNNISIGHNSMFFGMSQSNVAIGANSLYGLKYGSYNVSIGKSAAADLGGATSSLSTPNWQDNYNTFIGTFVAPGLVRGNYNTIISSKLGASDFIGFTQGNYNTYVGYGITGTVSSNQNNTVIGSRVTLVGGITNSIILADGSGNQRIFVNSLGYVGIGTQSPTALLTLSGLTYSLKIVDGTQGANKVLTSDSYGNASWATASGNTYYSGYGLTQSTGNTFSILLPVGSGLTVSSTGLSINSQISTNSSDFSVGNDEDGYFYYVTTGTSLITCTPPSGVSNGFEFTIMKVDNTNGVVQVAGVYEFSGSSNLSYLVRQNETITYKYDGSSWIAYIVDDGVIPPSTVLANMGATYGHAEEFPVLDINDTIQGAINYNQGGWSYDWLSGTIFSAYSPLTISNPATASSMFNTASNSFIGLTSSPLTIGAYNLKVGKSIRMLLTGTFSGSGIARFGGKIGSQTFSSSGSIALGSGTTNAPWRIEYEFKVLNVGSSGRVHGSGVFMCSNISATVSSTQNIMDGDAAYEIIDTTVDNKLDFLVRGTGSNFTIIHSTIERLA
jgi:hypothetical protein